MTEPRPDRLASLSLADLLTRVGERSAAPGGGAAVATTVAMAAALCAMAARFSDHTLDGAGQRAETAEVLVGRALALADADGAAYGAVLAARQDPDRTPEQLRAALEEASDVPLEVAEIGARVAATAQLLAAQGNPNLAGDVAVAQQLAVAAVAAATRLVEINLGQLPNEDPDRIRRVAAVRAAAGIPSGWIL
jgi:formiminotetrahydrofolate cyclodeaminase